MPTLCAPGQFDNRLPDLSYVIATDAPIIAAHRRHNSPLPTPVWQGPPREDVASPNRSSLRSRRCRHCPCMHQPFFHRRRTTARACKFRLQPQASAAWILLRCWLRTVDEYQQPAPPRCPRLLRVTNRLTRSRLIYVKNRGAGLIEPNFPMAARSSCTNSIWQPVDLTDYLHTLVATGL